MEFLDLKKQNRELRSEIMDAVQKTIDSGVFIGGEEVSEFEKEAAELSGAKYAISVNSGTDALFISLKSLGIGPGDEVITTPFTFFATAEAVANTGAKPVFCDIDLNTFNIDFLKAKITEKTKAAIPVHLFGKQADIPDLGIKIIEDAAQAIGIKLKGDAACFSFFPSKNLGGFGDGGMIVTNNEGFAGRARLLKNHGSDPKDKYRNLLLGGNSRLDSIQAAILRIKLRHLSEWNAKRTEIAEYYNQNLKDIVITPSGNNIYNQYTIRTEKRDGLKSFLQENGIPTMIYYPLPLHLQPAFKYLGCKEGDFPNAEKASKEVLSLPVYPELDRKDQDYIISKIKEFYDNGHSSVQE